MATEQPDRRSSDDRRTDDRRQGDRRSGDDSGYEGEERREGDRRTGEDRRSGEERRKEERKNLAKIAGYGLVGCLIPILILMTLTKLQGPPRRKSTGSRKLEVDTLEVVVKEPETTVVVPVEPEKTPIERLRDELLGLAPELYHGVKLERLISKTDPTAIDSMVTVEAIEFQVKGERWDSLTGTDKVVILNRTFRYLKQRFPFLTRTVRLIFDDGRPDLDLKFE